MDPKRVGRPRPPSETRSRNVSPNSHRCSRMWGEAWRYEQQNRVGRVPESLVGRFRVPQLALPREKNGVKSTNIAPPNDNRFHTGPTDFSKIYG